MMRVIRWLAQQQWIRFSLRKRLVRMWSKGRDLNIPFEADFFGLKYSGNLKDYIDRCVYFYGAYEKANLQLLKDIAIQSKSTVFVDIGANVGQHSLWMSQFCEVVHAFEPWHPVRKRLEEKVALNALSHVYVYGVGLGEKEDLLPFYAPPDSDTGIGSFIETHHDWNKASGQTLPIKVGDDFFAQENIEPSIIKLDVEGFEAKVLLGLQHILREFRPTVLLEFSPTAQEQFYSYAAFLEIFPYKVTVEKIVVLDNWHYKLEPFNFEECSDILIKPM